MRQLVASAKYKGETINSDKPIEFIPKFLHGGSYMIEITQQPGGAVRVSKLRLVNGRDYEVTLGYVVYDTVISFLVNWEEITSYPSLPVLGLDS